MVDPEKIRSLVEIMTEHDLCEFSWRSGEEEIVLKRPGTPVPPGNPAAAPVMYAQPALAPSAPAPSAPAPAESETPAAPVDEDAGLVAIASPMVGTLYTAADPESPPFVAEGARVSPTSVVCIVEAMKVFNEINAEVSGTIKRVLIKNEEPVEFGQPLFMVQPD